jgi:4-amino-4-deoxy-L-arabinose transferase-like glycosyltransferase
MTRTRVALLVIFGLALGVRFAYLAADPRPLFGAWVDGAMAHNIVDDGHWFDVNARDYALTPPSPSGMAHLIEPAAVNLRYADAHPQWEPQVGTPVGESALLAGLWEITGSERFLPDQILRIVLDALCALLVYRIAMQLFHRRRAALLSATFYALYPPIAWQAISPYIDFWAIDLTVAILAIQLQAARSTHPWRWLIACGLLVGVGVYFRPFVLLLSAALAIVLGLPAGWRAALGRVLAMTAVALALTIPWTVRNYNTFHAFVPFRSGLGQTMWEGLADLPNDFGGHFGEPEAHRELPGVVVESYEWDNLLKHKALHVIARHPLFYLELIAYRLGEATVLSYSPSWMHRTDVSPFSYKRGPVAFALERPFNLLEALLEPAAFLLALLSLAWTWKRWRRSHVVLATVALATILPYIPLFVVHRYVLPAAVAYLIWVGLGADLLLEALAHRLRIRQRVLARA